MAFTIPADVAGFRFFPVEFDLDARRVDDDQVRAATAHAGQPEVADVLVLSHGWNNHKQEALGLYTKLLGNVAKQNRGRLDVGETAVVGVFWPSKRFADRDLIPGGAAAAGGDVPDARLLEEIDNLAGFFEPDVVDKLKRAVPDLGKKSGQDRFVEALRGVLRAERRADGEVDAEIPSQFLTLPANQLLQRLTEPRPAEVADPGLGRGGVAAAGAAGPQGGVAWWGAGLVRGIKAGAFMALNLTTFWKMKRRAGLIGRVGLAPALREVRLAAPEARIHLAGHSFGARVVTAAALGGFEGDPPLPVSSLTLLQAAFSHHGFAEGWRPGRNGYFRRVITERRVTGPIVVTHTALDNPNRWAYPVASRVHRPDAAGVGDARDVHGALGANGAQRTPEASSGIETKLRPANRNYSFQPGEVYNLEAGRFVKSHGEVHGPQVANALLAAIAAPPPSPAGGRPLSGADEARAFNKRQLDKTVIAVPLLEQLREGELPAVIIDLNLLHSAGLAVARQIVHIQLIGYDRWKETGVDPVVRADVERVLEEARRAKQHEPGRESNVLLDEHPGILEEPDLLLSPEEAAVAGDVGGTSPTEAEVFLSRVVDLRKGSFTPQYVYANLSRDKIEELVELDQRVHPSAIYKVWPDFEVTTMLTKSVATVKGNAARIAFSAAGNDIVWAVADTGIDGDHPHFRQHRNLDLSRVRPLHHMDFTSRRAATLDAPIDPHGHGTHVAGIIAGESAVAEQDGAWSPECWSGTVQRDKRGNTEYQRWQLKEPIAGVAPSTKLVSLRVLGEDGTGSVSNLLAAIGYVQRVNEEGGWIRIQGVNMSVGYGFDPEWFGCGQSPLCVEVDRLVKSGVSVVVAAGNTGYWNRGGSGSVLNSGLDLTINDPGNAELAITVGSTHREKPERYGVSYFSSKGPTGDGRLKPDLVAPGEKVLSCAAGARMGPYAEPVDYCEDSGTSMAAPHVSGAIAAFLSIRREYIGQPERVKEIFLNSATDLGRERYLQGHGLVDLMRAIQSV